MTVDWRKRCPFPLKQEVTHDMWSWAGKQKKPKPSLWWVKWPGDKAKWSFREVTDLTCHAANVFTQTCNLQQEDWLTLILPLVPEGWLVALGCIRTDQCLKETSRDLRNVPEPIGPGILGAFSSLHSFFFIVFLFLRFPQIFLLLITYSFPQSHILKCKIS